MTELERDGSQTYMSTSHVLLIAPYQFRYNMAFEEFSHSLLSPELEIYSRTRLANTP